MHEEISTGFALSPQQRRLWTLRRADDAPGAYGVEARIEIEGCLDAGRLERALQSVVARYEVLRTAIRRLSDLELPSQVILDEAPVVPLAGAAAPAAVEPPEDLERGRPLRAALSRLGPERHRLEIALPAFCADAGTVGCLLRELAAAYDGSDPSSASDTEEVLQYADLAEWQNELLRSEETLEGRESWLEEELAGALSLRLPVSGGEEDAGFDPRRRALAPPAGLPERVEEKARELAVPPPAILLAAWAALLGRLAAAGRVLVAVTQDGRKYEELAATLGPFARDLPLLLETGGELPWRRLAERAAGALEKAHGLQEFFSWDAVAERQDLPAAPYAAFGFGFRQALEPVEAGSVRFLPGELGAIIDRFQVRLDAVAHPGGGLGLELGYDASSLAEAEVERLGRQLLTLLEHALEEPETSLERLRVLDGAERWRILDELGRGAPLEPSELRLEALIRRGAETTADSVALVFGERRLSYGELRRRSARLAARLRRRGAGRGAVVAICHPRSLEMVISMLAVLEAGGAYVPLDPAYPAERLAFVLADSGARLLLSEHGVSDRLPETAGVETLFLDAPEDDVRASDEKTAEAADSAARAAPTSADDLAYVLYTSGSTGRPKGVMVSHRNAVASTRARLAFYHDPNESFLLLSSYAFDSSVAGIYGTLAAGRTLVLPVEDLAVSLDRLGTVIARQRVRSLLSLPSVHALLLERPVEELRSLATVIVAGEACPVEVARRHQRALPEAGLWNEYGPTEGTVWATAYDCRRAGDAPRVAIGRPIAGVEAHLLDRFLEPVPVGAPGEVHLGGTGLARGYMARPGLTAERFVPHPFGRGWGQRLYRTGDLARHRPDGEIDFLGRRDDQVKIRGFRIELGEIEAILDRAPGVAQSVVAARGESPADLRLVAYLVAEAGHGLTVEALRSFLEERLPTHMVPAIFVPLAAFPLTPNGKVDRRALPAPELARLESGVDYAAPRTSIEEHLAKIWAEVLGVERIGRHDRFFSMGGDSILAIQAVSRANREGLYLNPAMLFQRQTIAELAGEVREAPGAVAEQGPVTGPAPLTPIQRWLFEQQEVDLHHWNQALLFELRFELEPAVLATALDVLLHHHDALRARFEPAPEGWRQRLAEPGGEMPLSWIDLSTPATGTAIAALAAAVAQAQTSLDLERGPLFRLVVLGRPGGGPSRLLLLAHHLVVDGVSWRLLVEDLATAYRQLARGEELRLPAKTSSSKRWAERLEEHVRAGGFDAQLAFWRSVAEPPPAPVPLDFEAGPDLAGSAERVGVELEADVSRALLREAPEVRRASLEELLLAALARTLAGWLGGVPSVLVALERHGREDLFEDVDLARTVGWLTAAFPVALDLRGAAEVGGALKAVKEALRRVPDGGIGYGALRYLAGRSGSALGDLPEPEISFNYLGRFESRAPESSPFRSAAEDAGPERSPRSRRSHRLQVIGRTAGGRLSFDWVYGQYHHRRETIEALAASFAEALRALATGAGGAEEEDAVPSDFPLAGVDQEELSKISGLLDGLDDD